MVKQVTVQLSDLKFVKPTQAQTSTGPESQPHNAPPSSQHHPAPNQFSYPGPWNTPHDRFAAEKPGEQLAPEGVIWQMYVEEAREHDNELVDGKNKNLDMMLLFAALFSAILTAFIIESKNLLQPDSTDIAVTILLAIAQSQQRIEQGDPQVISPIEISEFSASTSSRWINGLWFTALTLSLSAALIAMLAKEWLTFFMTSRPRPALAYTLLHQERIQGLARWRALHLIDLLPTMLHISLLFFFLGLAIYLWTLDIGITIAVLFTAGCTVLFYVGTALLSAFDESCPYITQISRYLRIILQSLFRDRGDRVASESKTTRAAFNDVYYHLRALSWLVGNTRDPAIGDCACQALAGIHATQPPDPNPSLESKLSKENTTESKTGTDGAGTNRAQIATLDRSTGHTRARYRLLVSLYDEVMSHFAESRRLLSHESVENKGMQMAQYASAMPALVRSWSPTTGLESEFHIGDQNQGRDVFRSAAAVAFEALDSVWIDECPSLSPDSYAMLVSADLRLIESVTHVYYVDAQTQMKSPSRHTNQRPIQAFRSLNSPSRGCAVIDIKSHTPGALEECVSIFELRARYSRTLARASFMLGYHQRCEVSISAHVLVHLLESIRLAAECSVLNDESHMSTCLPQSADINSLPAFQVQVLSDATTRIIDPLDIGDDDSLLFGLVRVLYLAGTQDSSAVELASGRALLRVGPMLVRQWLNAMNQSSDGPLSRYRVDLKVLDPILELWYEDRRTNEYDRIPYWALRQLLVTATIALVLADCPQMGTLPDVACTALCQRAQCVSGRNAMLELAHDDRQLITDLICQADLHRDRLSSGAVELLVQIMLVEHPIGSALRTRAIHFSGLPHLLNLASKTPYTLGLVQKTYTDLYSAVQEETTEVFSSEYAYIPAFVWTGEGFTALFDVARREEYKHTTIECIINLVHCASRSLGPLIDGGRLHRLATPALLEAVLLVLESKVSDDGHIHDPYPLIKDLMILLRSLSPEGRKSTIKLSTMAKIQQFLKDFTTGSAIPGGYPGFPRLSKSGLPLAIQTTSSINSTTNNDVLAKIMVELNSWAE